LGFSSDPLRLVARPSAFVEPQLVKRMRAPRDPIFGQSV